MFKRFRTQKVQRAAARTKPTILSDFLDFTKEVVANAGKLELFGNEGVHQPSIRGILSGDYLLCYGGKPVVDRKLSERADAVFGRAENVVDDLARLPFRLCKLEHSGDVVKRFVVGK